MADHPLDRRRVEQVGVVLEVDAQALGQVEHVDREVEARGRRRQLLQLARHAAHVAAARHVAVQHEQHLEQRRVVEVAARRQRLDEQVERHVLVRIGLAARVSRTRASSSRTVGSPDRSARSTMLLAKKPITRSISGRLRAPTAVPTAKSVLAAVAVQQDLEGRQQQPCTA